MAKGTSDNSKVIIADHVLWGHFFIQSWKHEWKQASQDSLT